MEIKGQEVYLSKAEVESATCPLNTKWIVAALSLYGIEKKFNSEILESAKRCPEILKKLGYRVKLKETGEEL
jgi:hypothetical protein